MILEKDSLPNLFVHPKSIDPSIQNSNAFSYLFRALYGCGINGLLKTIPLLMMLRYFAGSGIFCLTKTISSICRVHKVAVNMQIAKNSTEKKSSSFYTFLRICKSITKKCLSVEVSSQNTLGGPKMFFFARIVSPVLYVYCLSGLCAVCLASR